MFINTTCINLSDIGCSLGLSSQWALGNDKYSKQGEEMALDWLTSTDLLATIMSTMSDVQVAVNNAKQEGMHALLQFVSKKLILGKY